MRIMLIGDIFGEPGIAALEKHLPQLITKHRLDFIIAQAENVSDRKGFIPEDYARLKSAGVNAFTLGNHVWAKPEIDQIINAPDVIRPYNIPGAFSGRGSAIFNVKNQRVRVTSLLGIEFNELRTGWNNVVATNFFDALDTLIKADALTPTLHIVDFHGEVTSEKAVLGLYADGKISALVGTHTHVQTADARVLPKGTLFITDVGMTGPTNAAIGARYEDVYRKMRFQAKVRFGVSPNQVQLNAVILTFTKQGATIKALNYLLD